MSELPTFVPTGRVGALAIGSLTIAAIFEALGAVFAFAVPQAGKMSWSAEAYAVIWFIRLWLLIPVIVLFCIWSYRSRKNLAALGAHDLRFTPGGSVWAFFIPFVNLVRPAAVAQETWKASDPQLIDNGPAGRKLLPSYTLIWAWWFLLVSGCTVEQVGRAMHPAPSSVPLILTAHVSCLAAGIFGILLVRAVGNRQEARALALRSRFVPTAANTSQVSPAETTVPVVLYDLRAIDLATLFCSCLAGAFLVSRNLKALGDRRGARYAMAIGILAVVPLAFLTFSVEVPKRYDSLLAGAFQAGQVLAVHGISVRVLGDTLRRHRESGGAFFSRWRALGIGLLTLPVLLVILAVVAILFPNLPALAG